MTRRKNIPVSSHTRSFPKKNVSMTETHLRKLCVSFSKQDSILPLKDKFFSIFFNIISLEIE